MKWVRMSHDLKRVTYVTGDVAGTEESPVYAILNMKEMIAKLKLPEGYALGQTYNAPPWQDDRYAMKWDGEWQITYEVFRDLGIAFAAVAATGLTLVVVPLLYYALFRNAARPTG